MGTESNDKKRTINKHEMIDKCTSEKKPIDIPRISPEKDNR